MKLFQESGLRGIGWILLAVARTVSAGVLLETEFSGPAGPLAGRDGWSGRSDAVQADGKGLAGLGDADGFVKRRVSAPEKPGRIRLAAHVRVSALPDSAMRNHHLVGKEQPAWIALEFTDNESPKAGLAAAKLSASVSSDGTSVSIGLGRSVGAVAPEFGVFQAVGDGSGELALEYDFAAGRATAFWNGSAVLTGALRLQAQEVAWVGFQLRRMRPLGSAAPGGIDRLTVECSGASAAAAVAAVQPVPLRGPNLPLGSRENAEVVRAREIEARIDGAKTELETLAALKAGWDNPPATYRPHTRWWWPGNAVTKEGIDWQLEQMKEKGFGGVEIMSFLKVYEKGNIEFGSPEFFEMVHHAVAKAQELGLLVTPPLGPGWNHGHAWVPEQSRSKVLVIAEQAIAGGQPLECALAPPKEYTRQKRRIEAVVAVKLNTQGQPDSRQRVDLSANIKGAKDFTVNAKLQVSANLPAGRWRLMSFWTVYTGQKCAAENYDPPSAIVDHLDKKAVRGYAEYMGERYRALFGEHFGQTVDSFFGDSYELKQEDFLWSADLFELFKKEKGYDLRPYLPLLRYDGAPETPYVRYDFGHFLHLLGMEAAIGALVDYSDGVGVQMRQQPHYRFTAELIEASGRLPRPETENTKRSFEPMFWHKLTASGAQLYPSKEKRWVSAEAFTFINTKYRTTMEQIKRGTDLFLRDGVTQFYNHGYFYTPEKELEPARDLIWMNRISHVNTWWPYYRGLADYQARAAFLSRQGRAQASVLLYSPMPTVWSERAEFPCKHVRDVPFGKLPKMLVASGYDFDCVNDDLLQRHSEVRDGKLLINGYAYSALILPRVLCLAPETLAVVERFARAGGAVFALNALPQRTTGLLRHEERDQQLAQRVQSLFEPRGGSKSVGSGTTCYLPDCDGFDYLKAWSPGSVEWSATEPLSTAYVKFVAALRERLAPDFEIVGAPLSDGLTFRHTRIGQVDAWFICNLQPAAQRTEVILNTQERFAQLWNPLTGQIRAATKARATADGRLALTVDLQPWESLFALLTAAPDKALAPAPERRLDTAWTLSGTWAVAFSGLGGAQKQLSLTNLASWVALPGLKDFSGSAQYALDVALPPDITDGNKALFLDLGEVHEVAHVRVNGAEAGNVWMQPYRVEVTGLLRPGTNTFQISVANLLWNYAAGLAAPTPIPQALQEHYGATWNQEYGGWKSLQAAKRNHKDDRLPSGLLGPVRLLTTETSNAQ